MAIHLCLTSLGNSLGSIRASSVDLDQIWNQINLRPDLSKMGLLAVHLFATQYCHRANQLSQSKVNTNRMTKSGYLTGYDGLDKECFGNSYSDIMAIDDISQYTFGVFMRSCLYSRTNSIRCFNGSSEK